MFLNFGRFFGFGFQSKMDTLLKQQNLTLEQILSEDDILNELKNQSSGKFADFIINNPSEYKKMIGYIIDDVNEEEVDVKNKCIKYPFLISEILGAENENLINFLFEKPAENSQEEVQNPLEDHPTDQMSYSQSDKELIRASLLQELLKVLEKDSIVITTSGYFSKIIQAIIHKRGIDFWEFIKHNPDILTNVFKHTNQKHISEILEKLIILDTNQDEQEDRLFVQERQNLIQRLQKFMLGKQDSKSILSNCCEVLIEVYKRVLMSFETMTTLKDILLTSVENPSFFMKIAIHTQNPTVYNLLNAQFEFYNKVYQQEDEEFLNKYKSIINESTTALRQTDVLKVPFKTSYGKEVTPLGDTKLNLILLIIQLIQKDQLASAFENASAFQQIFNLLQQYPSNNQLQILFEKLVTTIIDTRNENLLTKFFLETDFVKVLIQINDPQKRNKEFGYYGVLTKITNLLNQKQLDFQIIAESIQQVQQDWDTYLANLIEINQKEQSFLLGVNPRRERQVDVNSYSPPLQMPEPLVQYPYTGFRKAESNEQNEQEQKENYEQNDQNEENDQKQEEIEAEQVSENVQEIQQPIEQVDVQEEKIEEASEPQEQNDQYQGHLQVDSPTEEVNVEQVQQVVEQQQEEQQQKVIEQSQHEQEEPDPQEISPQQKKQNIEDQEVKEQQVQEKNENTEVEEPLAEPLATQNKEANDQEAQGQE